MGKKGKNIGKDKNVLQESTLGWIYSIGSFAIAVIFILSSLGKAGVVNMLFVYLSRLFGVGYFLIPIVLIMLSVSFARTSKRPLSAIQAVGAVIFFISSLSLISLVTISNGGVVGNLISAPLVKLFDLYVTVVILSALVLISILVIFDLSLNFSRFSGLITAIIRRKQPVLTVDEAPKLSEASLAAIKNTESVRIDFDRSDSQTITQKVGSSNEFEVNLKSRSLNAKPFTPPPLSILERDRGKPGVGDIKANSNIIKRTLQNFGIIVEMDEISIGPSVTRYTLKPAEGVKLSKIIGLQNNLELALAAHPVRIEAPIPGKSLVGIEIPNSSKTTLGLGSLLEEEEYRSSTRALLISLGKSISGNAYFDNISEMPHMLIAGATGSGKSVMIHVLINSLLFRNSPENIKFIMIDPKRVELTLYNKIPHLLTGVITDAKRAIMALKWAAKEMERRYDILEKNKVRDINSYHTNLKATDMPFIVIIIDELADIMQAYPRELEAAIIRLAQMSRAVGIHLVLSTQRPSVNVITGLIKANIPTRVALQVASQIDSRTILDSAGAEKLLGAGDMLYLSAKMSKPVRLQSPYISETEVKKVAEYFAENYADTLNDIDLETQKSDSSIFETSMDPDGDDEDDLYAEAKGVVVEAGKASTSYLQRKLRIGYARAARLMDILEERGVIGPGEGAKPRDVLLKQSSFEPRDEVPSSNE